MSHNNNIHYNEDRDKIQKDNAIAVLNNIAESHSIKDRVLKKHSDIESLESVSKVRTKKDESEDNSDGSYKISNFL
ncbi:hypothetical protein K2F40_13160 [Clostridium sp. CM028]|uniref:hypothetical protein n=1 Tax=Clostridium sp. CM028 TaxID=2851575 RepID=UPI001C6F0C61|nr:hypothetical protein [Clostridium sp. CM028]MBW9149907.1 hypothetical protein [Clostridium sp. CM028]WLC63242.1 hypothetical protein KTC94_08350 [Clostridium sp. CM028]